MTKVGEHVTFDIIGTQKEYDPKFYEKLVYKIAKKAKVVVLEISKYKFEPQGFTLVALLAESHISFHTFPEKGIISFDFFTCGKVSPSVALEVLKKEGYIINFNIDKENENNGKKSINVDLKYYEGQPVIREIKRISKPGRRVYSRATSIPKVMNGLGLAIISTPKGVMSDVEARKNNVGGEIICRVF